MRVTLAYPWTAPDGTTYPGGETVDVPDDVGKQLLRDGKGRPASDQPQAGTSLDLDDPAPAGAPVPTATGYPGPTPPTKE